MVPNRRCALLFRIAAHPRHLRSSMKQLAKIVKMLTKWRIQIDRSQRKITINCQSCKMRTAWICINPRVMLISRLMPIKLVSQGKAGLRNPSWMGNHLGIHKTVGPSCQRRLKKGRAVQKRNKRMWRYIRELVYVQQMYKSKLMEWSWKM